MTNVERENQQRTNTMVFTNPTEAASHIHQRLTNANRVLILSHISPDGDAIGSLLGAWHMLQTLGVPAIPLASSTLPECSQWLPDIDQVQIYQPGMALPEADIVLMVDTASLQRIGLIYDEHRETLASLPIVIIDHHVTNDGHGQLNLINPQAASTCELLFRLIQAMNVAVTPATASCLLLGITTDTHSFQTSSTKPESLRVAAELLELGANHQQLVHQVYYTLPTTSAVLVGHALYTLQYQDQVAWTTITNTMMEESQAKDEAVGEVVRIMQRIRGIQALVVFKERKDGTTKLSLRSQPSINVATLAQQWGGDGHAQAAGAILRMTPEQAAAEVLPKLIELVKR